MKSLVFIVALSIVSAAPAYSQTTESESEVFYDIYIRDSCLTVWVDPSSLLGSKALERLRDGIDVALECRAELITPRWLWSDRLIVERVRTYRISYRPITRDYLLNCADTDQAASFSFPVEQDITGFLRDSVELCLDHISRIDPEKRYSVALRIIAISLTDLNLADGTAEGDQAGSPVRFLFRQFLELTDYGRRQATVKSRPFLISELLMPP